MRLKTPTPSRFALAAAALWLAAPPPAQAHKFTITRVVVDFTPDDAYSIDLRVDLDALALGASSETPSAENVARLRALSHDDLESAAKKAEDTVKQRVSIYFDGQRVTPAIAFPDRGAKPSAPNAEPTVLGITARLSGAIPQNAGEFSLKLSRAFGAMDLTIRDQAIHTETKQVVPIGESSPRYHLHQVPAPDESSAFGRYVVLGFEHILPRGLDHILFVLGLFLLSTQLRPLLLQITCFTVAHSVTLGLSVAGVASLPSRIVEPLIALSIAYVGVENMFVSELKPWRPAMVFAFGLLHGMGFAGVLRELGMPSGQFAATLVGFNLGVELGQLTVVSMAFLAVGLFRKRAWYRQSVVLPLSAVIALVGAYWAVQRAFGHG